ncbi:MAG: 30S ribosomal protein S4e [Candidatus Aenigmarchaeota archaeon]|nr:30S ribosomal protein S4e [Candidatus Aenigmarchaeota archaeon]
MHLKRLQASKNYHIAKKVLKFTISPKAGAHGKDRCIPLGILLRDMFGFAKTLSEAKIILNKGLMIVDGKTAKDYKTPVGFMDTISFPKISKNYRIVLKNGKLVPLEIEDKNSSFKLGKIIVKKHISGGKIQYGLHDGRTFLADAKKTVYSVGDTVQISVPEQEIKSHLPLSAGSIVMVTGGKHVGTVGKIKEIEIVKSSDPNMVLIDIEGTILRTLKDYVFVIGKDKPLIKIE